MGLTRFTDKIYYLEHEAEVDRPMLAYIKGIAFHLRLMLDILPLMWQISTQRFSQSSLNCLILR